VESGQQSGSGGKRGNWPGLARYAGMGLELAAAIIALTLVGLWVDHKFGTGHKGLITGAVLGVVGGLYNFIRQALSLMKQEEAARKGRKTDSGDDQSRPS
jgi:F0F1-type ATP synthase assembly protein I